MLEALGELALQAAKLASAEILDFYAQGVTAEFKSDHSPITAADRRAHQVISECLTNSNYEVVSEEGETLGMGLKDYWLVDPLDGTRDFLDRTDEFTVNIAFMRNNHPVLGLILAPALNEVYLGISGQGCRFWRADEIRGDQCRAHPRAPQLRMAISRSNAGPEESRFQRANQVGETLRIGSALKFARLSQGQFEVYPRFAGSSEWDTAAGQAILESIGGRVVDLSTGRPLAYGKADRRNGALVAFRAPYVYNDFKEI